MRAMGRAGKAGLALFSMRGREYLTAVHAEGGVLVAHTMHFADEVRDPRREVDNLPADDLAVSDRELSAAEQLIAMLAMDWKPDDWHDTYSEQVRELVQAKAEGREIAVSQEPAEASNVTDLMAVLERSLQAASQEPAQTTDARAQKSTDSEAAPRRPTAGRTPKAASGTKSTSARQPAKKSAAHKTTSAARAPKKEDLGALTKAELYKRATALDIAHRSTMTRDELQDALEHVPAKQRHLRSA